MPVTSCDEVRCKKLGVHCSHALMYSVSTEPGTHDPIYIKDNIYIRNPKNPSLTKATPPRTSPFIFTAMYRECYRGRYQQEKPPVKTYLKILNPPVCFWKTPLGSYFFDMAARYVHCTGP